MRETEGFNTQKCVVCNIDKKWSEYDKGKNFPTGYTRRCKQCRRVYDEDRKRRQATLSPIEGALQPADVNGATELLTNMGFVVGGVESVESQFKRRIQLKYGVILDNIKNPS